MKPTFRTMASAAAALAFATALALPALAQEKPEGAQAPPKMQKKAPAKKAPAKAAAKKAGSPEVMALQEALKKAGENPGPVDGKLGPKTRAALRAFQKKNKLKMSGRADKATMTKLEPFMTK